MKRLRFLFSCTIFLGLDIITAYAVVLPAQSYVPEPSEYFIYGTDETGAVKVVGTTFAMLGNSDKGPIENYCTATYPDSEGSENKAYCTQCCSSEEQKYIDQDPDNTETYKEDAKKCRAACAAYSLPLEGGMYILLALAVAFGAAKATMFHKKSGVELSLQCCNA